MDPTKYLGLAGAVIAGVGYMPQITHLVKEHCSAGISLKAQIIWMVSALLVLLNALSIQSPVFILLSAISLIATSVIIIFVRKFEDSYCPTHMPSISTP